jgi:hypothetical protein
MNLLFGYFDLCLDGFTKVSNQNFDLQSKIQKQAPDQKNPKIGKKS